MVQDFMRRALAKIRRETHRKLFQRAVAGVIQRPPLAAGTVPMTALSMVHTRDVLPYLLALHSFARHVNPERVVVVCDPTITEEDRSLLKRSVPHIELRRAEEFRTGRTPIGGCWERLTAITSYAVDAPVVQLDADTVTIGDIPEVLSAVLQGRGFVLGEEPDQQLVTHAAARDRAAPWQHPNAHIQAVSEFVMPQASLQGPWYVRGCAGFTGFHQDTDLAEKLFEFSAEMQRLTGDRWKEWGTEQVASNYLVANQRGTTVLPFPAYSTPDQFAKDPRFLHFIGSMRFETGLYTAQANAFLRGAH